MCRAAPHLLEQQRSFDRLRLYAEAGDRWSAELQSFPSRSGRMFFYVQVGTVTALALWDPGAEVGTHVDQLQIESVVVEQQSCSLVGFLGSELEPGRFTRF